MKGGRVDGMLKGTIEEGTERGRAGATETYGEVASEGGRSEVGREQRREGLSKGGAWERGSKGQMREGNVKGGTPSRILASIQYTMHNTPRPLPLKLWYCKRKIVDGYINSALLCVIMYCLTSGSHAFT